MRKKGGMSWVNGRLARLEKQMRPCDIQAPQCALRHRYGADGSIWFASELKSLAKDCARFETFPPGHIYSSKTGQVKKKKKKCLTRCQGYWYPRIV